MLLTTSFLLFFSLLNTFTIIQVSMFSTVTKCELYNQQNQKPVVKMLQCALSFIWMKRVARGLFGSRIYILRRSISPNYHSIMDTWDTTDSWPHQTPSCPFQPFSPYLSLQPLFYYNLDIILNYYLLQIYSKKKKTKNLHEKV